MKTSSPFKIILESYLFIIPPIKDVNFNVELYNICDKIDVVVVLPWVPAMAMQNLLLTTAASKSDLFIILKPIFLK